MQYFTARFFVKAIFTMNIFCENVHADFYGYLDVNFVVSIFGPNSYHPSPLRIVDYDEILARGLASLGKIGR